MAITLRPPIPADYPAIIAIGQQATTDYTLTVDDLQHVDRSRAPDVVIYRDVAVAPDGTIVGSRSSSQSAPTEDPRRFTIWLYVLPALQGRGIGRQLYHHLLDQVAAYRPLRLETGVCEHLVRAMRFAQEIEYGYTGVLPAYRNRGTARALKAHVLAWAKDQGYTQVRIWTSSQNAAMIRVNHALGFIPQYGTPFSHRRCRGSSARSSMV